MTTDINLQDIEQRVAEYIDKNFSGMPKAQSRTKAETKKTSARPKLMMARFIGAPVGAAAAISPIAVAAMDFVEMLKRNSGETFSEMLVRLIGESGEKNSAIYHRANIDRRHFYKIVHRKDYRPGKQTVLAFAVALKLNFDTAQKFLESAGYTLNKSSLSDVIVSFFLEYEIFDVNLINQILYKYDQPLLGG